jgi:hypothetical protein
MSDAPINWTLLQELKAKPHPLLNDVPLPDNVHVGVGEVMDEAKVAHHLLDIAQIPHSRDDSVYSSDLDARTFQLVAAWSDQNNLLGDIAGLHQQGTGPHGTVSGCCAECERPWPCDTKRIIDGEDIQ